MAVRKLLIRKKIWAKSNIRVRLDINWICWGEKPLAINAERGWAKIKAIKEIIIKSMLRHDEGTPLHGIEIIAKKVNYILNNEIYVLKLFLW